MILSIFQTAPDTNGKCTVSWQNVFYLKRNCKRLLRPKIFFYLSQVFMGLTLEYYYCRNFGQEVMVLYTGQQVSMF
jgi:hypothetical protein